MPTNQPETHLAVISERKALGWVLDHQRIAFPEPRLRNIFPMLRKDDVLYLYTTRQCFHNPHRDRGRVIGRATLASNLERLDQPLALSGRDMVYAADIRVDALAPAGEGFDMAAGIDKLDSFPIRERWSVYLRRNTFEISKHDAKVLDRFLKSFEGKLNDNIGEYQIRARMGVVHASEAAR